MRRGGHDTGEISLNLSQGTGIGRGFLSVLDTAWLVKRWSEADRSDRQSCTEVIREREKLYCLLRQTDPGGLRSLGARWGIDPGTRYLSRQFTFNTSHVASLYRWEEDQ